MGNQQFIQMKVDEIYEEQYATKVNEIGANTIIDGWKNKDSSIYKEVSRLVDNLNIQAFKVNEENGLSEGTDDIQAPENGNPDQMDGHLLEDNMEEDSPLPERVSNKSGKTSTSPKIDFPKLTTTQRRTSLDLMYTVPRFSTGISDQIPALTKTRPNLSKPASATTTNINVTTKTDIITNPNQKQLTVSNSNRFQNFLRKIKLKITRNVNEVGSSPKSPLIVQLDDTLKGKPENIADDPKNIHGKQGKDKTRYKLSGLEKGRRLSLVGENLPLYIRQQLEANYSNQNPVLENSSFQVDSASSRSLSRRQSRMHNLLENSQSLYSQSKDLSLVGSGTNQDDDTMPNTSEIERLNENNDETENGSDDDKEYILPDLLARYYGGDANEEDLITNINEIEDAFDFINVRSYDAYEDMEGEDEEDEEDEDYNEDDEYLFKI